MQKDRDFVGYPEAKEGPKAPPFRAIPGTNPVLKGMPLTAAAYAVTTFPSLASFLFSNGGFGCLRTVPELMEYEPRYDPTVIRREVEAVQGKGASQTTGNQYENPTEGPYTTTGDFYTAYANGTTTPLKVVETIFNLLESVPQLRNAFISIRKEDVMAAAEAATKRYREGKAQGPLDGVPLAVKDELELANHARTLGTNMTFPSPHNLTSWCTQQWLSAGAIIIGTLNMHELGLDTCGNNPHTGTPPNPHSASHYPGGSSSASATTVSSNLLPLTLGCDGGGSIRIPSTYCGIYGLKPTHGRVGRSPTVSIAYSTSVAGPMASTMADLELGYRVMAQPDPSERSSRQFAAPERVGPRTKAGAPKRVLGVVKAWFESADAEVLKACHEALDHYRHELGYEVVEIEIPYLREGAVAHAMSISCEAGTSVSDPSVSFTDAAARGLIPVRKLQPGNQVLVSVFKQTPAHDFLLAQKMRGLLMQHLAWLWERHPGMLIVSPTTPNCGWRIGKGEAGGVGVSDGNMSVKNMTFIWLANFTGLPAITVPVGRDAGKGAGDEKVPVGLMAMGEWGDEKGCIEWGFEAEEWAWQRDQEGKMERPKGYWADVLKDASK